jgi:DNA ligase-1
MLAEARAPGAAAGLALAVEAPPDIEPAGHLVSEKFDGVRALWTGSVLLFRSGLPVAAPAWFTAALPQGTALDGELWLGRGRFEALSGTVRRAQPDDAAWQALRFMVFDMPQAAGGFAARSDALARLVRRLGHPALQAVEQLRLPSRAALQQHLAAVLAEGGEGLVLQRADAPYTPGRSGAVLKLKPLHDAEAVVVGHVPGRGKHAGRLGALRVRTAGGVEFLIGTGFSDAQRASPPPAGSVVTFTHRGVTAGGVPRFASFLRERSV